MTATDGSIIGTPTKVVDSGEDSECWNLVIFGDGYLEDELVLYHQHVDAFLATLAVTPPFTLFRDAINVYRVDVASAESGARWLPTDTSPRTFFDATFNTGWDGQPLEYLLSVTDGHAVNTARGLPVDYHQILVIVNSRKYGGSGRAERHLAVCSAEASSARIAIHEIGHAAFKLADEYVFAGSGRATGGEPIEENVTLDPNAVGKWAAMIDPTTPLPTLPATGGAGRIQGPLVWPPVGTYEGARYFESGIYRSYLCCYMNNYDPFCAVCTAEIERILAPFKPEPIEPPDPVVPDPAAVPDSTTPNPGEIPMTFNPQFDTTASAVSEGEAVTLMGYLRAGDSASKARLFVSSWFDEWVVLNETDILAQIHGDDRPDGRSVLWVKREAEIVVVRKTNALEYANEDAERNRAGAGGGGYVPPPPKRPPG